MLQAGHHLLRIALLLLLHGGILAVVGLGLHDLHLEDIVNSNASATLNLLLRPLIVLLPHVHDRSCRRAVRLFAVETLVVFGDLVGHAAVLSLSGPSTSTLVVQMLLRVIGFIVLLSLIRPLRYRISSIVF